MRSIFTILLVLFIPFVILAQKKINKIIFLTASQIPITDVVIQDHLTGYTASSDEVGTIYLHTLPNSIKALQASKPGYEPATITLDAIESTEGNAVVVLKSKAFTMQDVTVTANARKNGGSTIADIDIQLRPITNSQEVLRMVPGLFIGQHAGGGKAEQIFLRGFDIDHGTDVAISVDGMPVNMVSHAHGQGYADLHFVIPELIENVSFQKGSYAADKGNFATAGFVSFKTKTYLERNFIKTEAGRFGTYRSVAGINLLRPVTAGNTRSLYLGGEAFLSKGFFENPQDLNRFNALLKYHGSVGKESSLTALVSIFKSRWNASGQIPEREVAKGNIGYFGAIDPTEGGQTSRYNASVELKTKRGENATWKHQLYFTRYAFDLFSNFTFFKEDAVNGDRIRQKENRNMYGYNGSYQKDFFIKGMRAVTLAGIQLRHDAVKDVLLTRVKDRITTIQPVQLGDVNEGNAGVYLSQRIMLWRNLGVTAGVRYDRFANQYKNKLTNQTGEASSSIISPKLNIDVTVNENVQLYWHNGRGFHSNDTRVVVAERGYKTLPPALSTDVGGVFKLAPRLFLQAAAWHLWLDQEFIYVGDEGIVEPGGRTRRIGADLSVRYGFANNLFLNLDLNYASPTLLDAPKEENSVPLAPRFTSVGGLVYKQQYGFGGSLLYRLMGNRPATEDNSITAKGYCIVDTELTYTKPGWAAGLSVQNILNSRWKETQFATESRLQNEAEPVTEIHFTPGSPLFAKLHFTLLF